MINKILIVTEEQLAKGVVEKKIAGIKAEVSNGMKHSLYISQMVVLPSGKIAVTLSWLR